MKFLSFITSFFRSPIGKEAIKIVVSDSQKVIALLLTLPIAALARESIRTANNSSWSGQQKFEVVLAEVMPILRDLITDKGMKVEPGDIEDIARGFVQAVYNDTMSARAAGVARAILALFRVL